MKVYRGAAAAARHYVETDRARADDYYLAEGSGLAERYSAVADSAVTHLGAMDGDSYERWVGGHDPATGEGKGRLRTDDQAVRFCEVIVNGPKSWSLAAALDPEIADAYDTAQDHAAAEITAYLAAHATTRVGPRGRQVQIPVERLETAVVRHRTSRAGDPHVHLHLQVNARVWAAGKWRGLHTVGVRDSLDAINGIGHAAVMCNPGFRAALAARGLTLDEHTGEIEQLAPYVGAFSARTAQIGRHLDRFEADWRQANPGQEPGPRLRQAWDTRAWKTHRPDKVAPTSGYTLIRHWIEELYELGFRMPAPPTSPPDLTTVQAGALDRDAVVSDVVVALGARRSAWNIADARGAVEQAIATTDLVASTAVRTELAEDLTTRVTAQCVPLLRLGSGPSQVPEHVRALSTLR